MDVEIGVLWFSVAVHYRRMSYRRIPLSLLFRSVHGDVNFGLRGKFWLWVELPRSRPFWLPLTVWMGYSLTGGGVLPFYRQFPAVLVTVFTGG